jgi:hypothetical protein
VRACARARACVCSCVRVRVCVCVRARARMGMAGKISSLSMCGFVRVGAGWVLLREATFLDAGKGEYCFGGPAGSRLSGWQVSPRGWGLQPQCECRYHTAISRLHQDPGQRPSWHWVCKFVVCIYLFCYVLFLVYFWFVLFCSVFLSFFSRHPFPVRGCPRSSSCLHACLRKICRSL